MNNNYFCSPELSKKLEKLGVESQFDFYWNKQGKIVSHQYGGSVEGNGVSTSDFVEFQKAYHFSDILLPENAKKIWGKAYTFVFAEKFILAMYAVGFEEEWQQYLEEEVDKKLNQ